MKLNLNVLFAIFWRNFISYFSNPTGYVFICLFVLVTAFAAFWPDDFFSANLANLDQLNKYLPWIMLLFIPAVTMSIWAEERQEGTDELLLTIPARDLDVVLGKYLAAVAIYTVALLFSVVNVAMLYNLGSPDGGLLFANYVGYWFVGVAMLSVGMVASFMTSNLTVAFILGVVFNAPLVFSASADVLGNILTMVCAKILPESWMPGLSARFESLGRFLSSFSIAEQFQDFGRGLITVSALTYFISITVVMLYLSMVLIGRRHWTSGRDNKSMGGHYLLRAVSLLLVAIGLNLIFARMDRRLDVSREQLSSLSPKTIDLLAKLKTDRPISIQAYISPDVPERYVQTRLNLISMLREIDRRGGNDVVVKINNTEAFSPKAEEAEQQFGITPRELESSTKGNAKGNEVFLGVAVSSGLSKVVIPFVDRGIPVEYELVRSIVTVSEEKKPRLGLVGTDAKMMAGFDMQTFRQTPGARVVDELQKQYEVIPVDASNPIELTEELEEKDAKGNVIKITKPKYKALMVVQPSKMAPMQLENLMRAMREGAPTAVFEDPLPYFGLAPPTSQKRQAPQQNPMFGMGAPPPEQCDIQRLWDLLGVDFSGPDAPDMNPSGGRRPMMPDKSGTKIVWQDYNPHPKLGAFPPLFVFIGPPMDEWEPFDPALPMTARLQSLLFPFPGEIRKRGSRLTYTPLVKTKKGSHGTIGFGTLEAQFQQVMQGQVMIGFKRLVEPSVIAYQIQGRPPVENLPMADEKADEKAAEKGGLSKSEVKGKQMNVVLVSDIDFFDGRFFALREQGTDPDNPYSNMNLDNVTFVLNILDSLAGEDRFIDVRNRRRQHRTLSEVEKQVNILQDRIDEVRKDAEKRIRTQEDEGNKKIEEMIKDLETQLQKENPDIEAVLQERKRVQKEEQDKLNRVVARATRDANAEMKRTEREVGRDTRQLQDGYKLAAVIVPPILPLVLAVGVLFVRRSREREGISKKRLR